MAMFSLSNWLPSSEYTELPEDNGVLDLTTEELEAAVLARNYISMNPLVSSIAINVNDFAVDTREPNWDLGEAHVVVCRHSNYFKMVEHNTDTVFTCELPDSLV